MIFGLGKKSSKDPFEVLQVIRGFSGKDDVEFDIYYCGISQFDVQYCDNELGNTNYPIVPGREMTGLVRYVGENVRDFGIGEPVGVGTLVDSCLNCDECKLHKEHACLTGYTMAFNEPTKHGHLSTHLGYTMGGFSQRISVNRNFVIKLPFKYPLSSAAACLTSGTSSYAPLRRFGALKRLGPKDNPKKVGVVGLGNMGMSGLRISNAMGCEATALSVHESKESLAYELGAQHFLNWTKAEDMKNAFNAFDIIINTLWGQHDLSCFLPFLRHDGTLIQLGLHDQSHSLVQYPQLLRPCLTVSGYISASVTDARDAINFCAHKKILPIQTIVLADQLDDVFAIMANPATTITRYTLDVRKSMEKLAKSFHTSEDKDAKGGESSWFKKQRQQFDKKSSRKLLRSGHEEEPQFKDERDHQLPSAKPGDNVTLVPTEKEIEHCLPKHPRIKQVENKKPMGMLPQNKKNLPLTKDPMKKVIKKVNAQMQKLSKEKSRVRPTRKASTKKIEHPVIKRRTTIRSRKLRSETAKNNMKPHLAKHEPPKGKQDGQYPKGSTKLPRDLIKSSNPQAKENFKSGPKKQSHVSILRISRKVPFKDEDVERNVNIVLSDYLRPSGEINRNPSNVVYPESTKKRRQSPKEGSHTWSQDEFYNPTTKIKRLTKINRKNVPRSSQTKPK